MARHDELLDEGAREAPEPETAEERSKKLGLKTAGGGIAAGGIAAAKIGGFSKLLLWLFVWNGVNSGWRIGGWIGLAVAAAAIALYVVVRHRRQAS